MDGTIHHRVIRLRAPDVRVDLVQVPLDDRALARWMAGGSPGRRARASRYHRAADAIRCLASEALLGHVLRDECQIDLTVRTLDVTAEGKPFLADHPRVAFNLSHSGEWVACAIGAAPLGVDVEVARPMDDLPASQVMSAVELDRFLALDADSRVDDFYRLWTLKESVLKALGTGLSLDPRLITIEEIDGHPRITRIPASCGNRHWDVRALEMPRGVHAAVCVASGRYAG